MHRRLICCLVSGGRRRGGHRPHHRRRSSCVLVFRLFPPGFCGFFNVDLFTRELWIL